MSGSDTINGYVIVVRFTTRAEQGEAFARRIIAFSAHMHSQPGCLQYDLSRDPTKPDSFVLYEVFENEAAWSLHHAQPAVTALLAEIGPMLAMEPDRTVWHRLLH